MDQEQFHPTLPGNRPLTVDETTMSYHRVLADRVHRNMEERKAKEDSDQ